MTRVLHYGMSPNLGGIETYLLNLTKHADSSRFEFDFLYSDQGQEPVFAEDLKPNGHKFYGVTPRRTSPRRNRADLEALFETQKFDVLHFHANTASYVEPIRAALRHGVRVIYHSHNAGASRSRITRLLHRWNQLTLPWADITRVAVSGEAGRWMFGRQSFQVIHNGIDVDAFAFSPAGREQIRSELGLRPDALVIGSVAAFLPAKNHEFLLAVFSEVVRRQENAHLLLVGSGPREERARQLVQQLELEDRVLFLGRRSDVPTLLSGMDRLLLPSLHEGFPLVAIEAQASGLPCLISEAVNPEVLVSPFATQLPLNQPPVAWAEALLAEPQIDRAEGTKMVSAAGLSTTSASKRVESLYVPRRS